MGPFAEALEKRQVPALLSFPVAVLPVSEAQPNDTVDRAQTLGDLSVTREVGARGTIGNGPAGAADVDWYHFSLDAPASVTLTAGAASQGGTFQAGLSLYNEDLNDFGDPLDPLGRRLLAQDEAVAPVDLAQLVATLGPGSYAVAVSGAGNRFFHPLMSASGYSGSTGNYNLLLSARAIGLGTGSGPAVLASDPTAGASLASSPLGIRLDLSGPLDPNTVNAGTTVRLVYSPTGTFGDGNDVDVPLSSINFSAAASELQLFPQAALDPGNYRIVLAGDASSGKAVLTGLDGTPLGSDAIHPQGRDLDVSFRVTGIEGGTAADDTLATAHDLGDVTTAGRVQVVGTLGDDPYYNGGSADPAYNPGNDVDFYRFHIDGTGPYALLVEIFAGRIGSPLDAGVALYRSDFSNKSLRFIAGNQNTQNQAAATDGSNPLLLDPALFTSLTSGDYVLVVSSGFNTPSPLEGQALDAPGLYNPEVSHSGQAGSGIGPYVLNLQVQHVPEPPRVIATDPAEGSVLTAPPNDLSVQFTEPVNLQQAGFQAYLKNSQSAIASVYILGTDGTKYFPRLESVDPATNRATFLMLDGLPNGSYEFHLSGLGGLTDLGGHPLRGNDPGGDYVVRFKVDGPARGSGTDPPARTAQEPAGGVQDLGVLFPHELQGGVTVTRDPASESVPAQGDTEDAFRFEVLQNQVYTFAVQGFEALPSNPLWLTDIQGRPVDFGPQGDGSAIAADLLPGVYVIHVGGWSPDQAAALTYRLRVTFLGSADNPVPLVAGPVPALQLRVNTRREPNLPDIPTPPVVPPDDGEIIAPPRPDLPDIPTPPVVPPPLPPPGDTAPIGGQAGGSDAAASGEAGHQGATLGTPGSTPLGNSASPVSTARMNPVGLIALSIAPVGSPNGNAEPFDPASAQVAFSLPSQARSIPSLGQALVSLVTTTQLLGGDDPGGPNGSIVENPVGEVDGPDLVFDEALKQVSEAASPLPYDAAAVVETNPTPDALPPTRGEPEPTPDGAPLLADDRTLSQEARERGVKEVRGGTWLADLAWGAALASLASIPIALVHRNRTAHFGPCAVFGLDRTANGPEGPAGPRSGLSGPKDGWNRRSRLLKIRQRGRVVIAKQGS